MNPVARAARLLRPLPALLLVLFVARFAVDVPTGAQWSLPRFLDSGRVPGPFVLPTLVAAPLARLTGWDVRAELWIGVIALLAAAFVVARRVRDDGLPHADLTALAASALLLSVAGVEGLLLGRFLGWSLAFLAVVLALSAAEAGRPVAAALSCLAATFAAPHGAVAWLAVWPATLDWAYGSARLAFVAAAAAAAAGVFPIGAEGAASLADAGAFSAAALGAPLASIFADAGWQAAPGVGFALAVVSAAAFVMWRSRGRSGFEAGLLVFALASTVFFGFAAAAGRQEAASVSRYAPFSLLILVALLLHLRRLPRAGPWVAAAAFAVIVLAAALVPRAAREANELRARLEVAQACLELIHRVAPEVPGPGATCANALAPPSAGAGWAQVVAEAERARALGLRRWAADLALTIRPDPTIVHGYVNGPPPGAAPALEPGRDASVAGWAVAPWAPWAARLVLVTRVADGMLVATAAASEPSDDVARQLRNERFARVRFSARLRADVARRGEPLDVWVYDPQNAALARVGGARFEAAP